VHAHGVDVGPVEQGLVGGRVVALDPVDQLVLAQEPRPRGLRRNSRRFGFSQRSRLGLDCSWLGGGLLGRLAGKRF
jgi:hypothetical protein